MNRAERRDLQKRGASKETVDKLDAMSSPCTIAEALQISRASADDAISDYHQNQGHVRLAMSIQIEVLKDLLFKSGIINEEEFKNKYIEKIEEVKEWQREKAKESEEPTMKVTAGDVEVKVEE